MSQKPPGRPPHRARFVTVCQQLLALGLIVAVLTPAANVVSLDVVTERPGAASDPTAPTAFAAYARAAQQTSVVPDEAVEATVKEYALTPPANAKVAPGSLMSRSARGADGATTLTSLPQPVTGYGTVGVTWGPGQNLAEDAIGVEARMQTDGAWSDWMPITYHDEHGPDPGTAEAARARPGTDELLVGEVDHVQVRVTTDRAAPSDMKLAVIDPGETSNTTVEGPELDTASEAGGDGLVPIPGAVAERSADLGSDLGSEGDAIALQAATYTPKPVIYSRAQWGADEDLRDKGSLRYFEVHAGFVHHTVNANNYTRAQVPALLRSIYAYHTKSRGWSDVGYNFLVDRFGRIWEGRFGGVDRPVVGAHTLGYNDDSFAMSAIGNFDIAQPSKAVIQAYGALFAWKLSLHGVTATSGKQYVTSRNFKAINGHRDAGSTACPGRYLYAKLPEIRRLAGQAQRGWAGRQLESNLGAGPLPDLIVRQRSDGQAFVIPIKTRRDGTFKAGKPVATGRSLAMADRVMNAGDWDRNGYGDVMFRHRVNGSLYLYLGAADGSFRGPIRIAPGFTRVRLLAAVGDMTGDGWPDLMGQPAGGDMRIYPGLGAQGLRPSYVAYSGIRAGKQIPVGLWDGDGAPDTLFRRDGAMSVYRGNGPGGLIGAKALTLNSKAYDWVVGISDVRLTGHGDLVFRSRTTKQLYLVEATATGFGAPVLLGTGFGGFDLAG
ncbi:MAG: N-acetylmuramoyl-L-alanine amidase [Actinomycetota bacterium]|nr:N-acetylmuramoyl-L-alanine amidase [Actinomycetota bacterium]